jgi:hypothetical protein
MSTAASTPAISATALCKSFGDKVVRSVSAA